MSEEIDFLIVDEDEGICDTLADIFQEKGCQAETAGTGQEAVEKARRDPFQVTLLDIRLPDISGIEVLKGLKAMDPETAVIMITGWASLENSIEALNEGAYAYVVKPFNMDEVIATVDRALERQRLIPENNRVLKELRDSFLGIITSLTAAIDAKDSRTRGHSERVAEYAMAMAKGLGWGPERE